VPGRILNNAHCPLPTSGRHEKNTYFSRSGSPAAHLRRAMETPRLDRVDFDRLQKPRRSSPSRVQCSESCRRRLSVSVSFSTATMIPRATPGGAWPENRQGQEESRCGKSKYSLSWADLMLVAGRCALFSIPRALHCSRSAWRSRVYLPLRQRHPTSRVQSAGRSAERVSGTTAATAISRSSSRPRPLS